MRDAVIFPARLQDGIASVQEWLERNDGKAIYVSPVFVCPQLVEYGVREVRMNGAVCFQSLVDIAEAASNKPALTTAIGTTATIVHT